MQQSLYQNNRHSLLMMAGAIFVSVTAAVIVSTVIIMSLMRGEIASALTSTVQNSSPTAQNASSCAVPQNEQTTEAVSAPEATSASVYGGSGAAMPLTSSVHFTKYAPASVSNSYNSSNVSNTTTTNNIKNTEVNTKVKVTNIKDSFNDNSKTTNVKVIKDSYNPVIIKDNEVNVNSNNNTAINSGNETKVYKHVENTNNVTTNVASNNTTTTNSNNTVENHLLSDNTAIIVPLVAPVPTT